MIIEVLRLLHFAGFQSRCAHIKRRLFDGCQLLLLELLIHLVLIGSLDKSTAQHKLLKFLVCLAGLCLLLVTVLALETEVEHGNQLLVGYWLTWLEHSVPHSFLSLGVEIREVGDLFTDHILEPSLRSSSPDHDHT